MLVNVERLRAKMAAEGLDGIVATTLENVHYFSGVWSTSLNMFPRDGQHYAVVTIDQPDAPVMVSPTLEVDQMADGFSTIQDVVNFGTFYREPSVSGPLNAVEQILSQRSDVSKAAPGPVEALIAALKQMGLAGKKVGVDEVGLKPGFFDKLAQDLPGTTFVPATALLGWVRRVKTAEEVARIRASAFATERAILAATGIAKEGITEYEMAREFERSLVGQGAIPKFTQIRFGRNAVAGQVFPDRTPLQKGDLIWFDVGCIYKGYWSDLARNFSLGETNDRARTIYAAMLAGEQAAIDQTRPGMTGGELFDLTLAATRAAGAPHYRRHHLGHGIGAEVYEQALIAPGNPNIIEEGAVVNIETPYYEYGLGALHVEDPYVVRAGGNEMLTTLSRELVVLPER
jgi:Xaa-Pro aminopeptidase